MIAYFVVASICTCLGFLLAALARSARITALHAEIGALRAENEALRRRENAGWHGHGAQGVQSSDLAA